jgi:hypothetical protein
MTSQNIDLPSWDTCVCVYIYVAVVYKAIINPFIFVFMAPIPVIIIHNRMQNMKIKKNKLVIKATLSNGQNSCPRPPESS